MMAVTIFSRDEDGTFDRFKIILAMDHSMDGLNLLCVISEKRLRAVHFRKRY